MKIKTSVIVLLLACVVSGLMVTGCSDSSTSMAPATTNAPAMTNMPPTNAPAK